MVGAGARRYNPSVEGRFTPKSICGRVPSPRTLLRHAFHQRHPNRSRRHRRECRGDPPDGRPVVPPLPDRQGRRLRPRGRPDRPATGPGLEPDGGVLARAGDRARRGTRRRPEPDPDAGPVDPPRRRPRAAARRRRHPSFDPRCGAGREPVGLGASPGPPDSRARRDRHGASPRWRRLPRRGGAARGGDRRSSAPACGRDDALQRLEARSRADAVATRRLRRGARLGRASRDLSRPRLEHARVAASSPLPPRHGSLRPGMGRPWTRGSRRLGANRGILRTPAGDLVVERHRARQAHRRRRRRGIRLDLGRAASDRRRSGSGGLRGRLSGRSRHGCGQRRAAAARSPETAVGSRRR